MCPYVLKESMMGHENTKTYNCTCANGKQSIVSLLQSTAEHCKICSMREPHCKGIRKEKAV